MTRVHVWNCGCTECSESREAISLEQGAHGAMTQNTANALRDIARATCGNQLELDVADARTLECAADEWEEREAAAENMVRHAEATVRCAIERGSCAGATVHDVLAALATLDLTGASMIGRVFANVRRQSPQASEDWQWARAADIVRDASLRTICDGASYAPLPNADGRCRRCGRDADGHQQIASTERAS